jgi:hypothetical protein
LSILENYIIPKTKFEVEHTLRKYRSLKFQIDLIEKDLIEDIYAPSAASMEMGSRLIVRIERIPIKNPKGKFERTKKGKIKYTRKRYTVKEEIPIFARSFGLKSDPTFSKTQKIIAYKKRIQKELIKMKFIVKVIEDELNKHQERQRYGTERQKQDARLKNQILIELMNGYLSDSGIQAKLSIPERTYYRWKNELITSLLDEFRRYNK